MTNIIATANYDNGGNADRRPVIVDRQRRPPTPTANRQPQVLRDQLELLVHYQRTMAQAAEAAQRRRDKAAAEQAEVGD